MAKTKTIGLKALGWTRDWVKNFDLFSIPITLTFKGEKQFNTFYGGFVSILIMGLMFGYMISLAVTVFTRADTTTSVNTFTKNMLTDKTVHYPGLDTFAIGLKFNYLNLTSGSLSPQTLFDKTVLEFDIVQVISTRQANGTVRTTETSLGYESWGSNFRLLNPDIVKTQRIQDFICPKNKNYRLKSNFNSNSWETVLVKIRRWTGDLCKSDAEIEGVINSSIIGKLHIIIPALKILNDMLKFFHLLDFSQN